jgi:maleate cis-trans isomerase
VRDEMRVELIVSSSNSRLEPLALRTRLKASEVSPHCTRAATARLTSAELAGWQFQLA